MNIRKLQLGCGGVKGPGCDIDIDNLSLSGNCETNRPGCSASLTRPFVEFAIKNDNSTTLREIVGFRLSAELAAGLLTAGVNDGTANGINVLSGFLKVAPTTGTTTTAQAQFTQQLEGLLTTGSCGTGFTRNLSCAGFRTTGGPGLTIDPQTVTFNVPAFNVNASRIPSLGITGITSTILSIPITTSSGFYTAQAVSINATDGTSYNSCLFGVVCGINLSNVRLNSSLANLSVNITLNEDLGFIHKIPVNNPFSLSLQREAVKWPGSDPEDVAQQGWWLAFADPVNLGDLSTPAGFEVDISGVFPQVAGFVNNYLRTRSNAVFVPFTSAVGALFTGQITLNVPPINLAGNTASLSLVNLPLGEAQNVPRNCWGAASFC